MKDYRFNAVSISSILKGNLPAQGIQGSIAGVYKRAANIEIGGYLITIADVSQRNLPYGILCDFSGIDLQAVLQAGDEAEINSEKLSVQKRFFEITFRSASIWQPEFYMPIIGEDIDSIQKNIDYLKLQIIQENSPDGLIPLFNYLPSIMNYSPSEKISSSFLIQKAYGSLRETIEAIRNGNEGMLIENFKQLTGLGPGLTPSGDDILMGLFATLGMTSKAPYRNWVMAFLDKILPQIKGLTTAVSFNTMKAASQGFYPERVSNLISKIITCKKTADIQPALQEMLQWGETSGYEIILGIIIGFSLAIERLSTVNN
jgi:hypothetical protein